MPWEDVTVMDAKMRFVKAYYADVKSGMRSMTALCSEYGVARKTGYSLIARHAAFGLRGLGPGSKAPHGGPHWYDPELIARVIELREEFPHWGAETILDAIARTDPDLERPSASTAHGWLKSAGLVDRTRRRRRFPHPGKPPQIPIERPNQQWSVDFKGDFRTGDRRRCYPLTVADSYSRYLLDCRALRATSFQAVWPCFERLFRMHGLPESILSDNGTPFSSNSVKRLSKLSVRWIRLGITPRLTQPGRPQQNGRHERIHGHMDPLVCSRPEHDAVRQQKSFDWFTDHHNNVRPNRALAGKIPSELYTTSPRPYPRRLPQLEYPATAEIRRVRSSGEIRWQGQWFFLSDALIGEYVAFQRIDNDLWLLSFGPLELGCYSERERRLFLDRPRPAGKAEND
jgi:transposase InsO family protein